MVTIPVNNIPKPIRTFPRALLFCFFNALTTSVPAISATGASVEGLKSSRIPTAPPASRSIRRMIWPVTVVPTLAPTMMPSDCRTVRMLAATRPAVIRIVALDDWIRAVTKRPSRNAFHGLLVAFSMILFRVPDDPSFKPSPIRLMPYRNMHNPPIRFRTLLIFMSLRLSCQIVAVFIIRLSQTSCALLK